jgi:hypothetical protein
MEAYYGRWPSSAPDAALRKEHLFRRFGLRMLVKELLYYSSAIFGGLSTFMPAL